MYPSAVDHEVARRELVRGKMLLMQLKATLERSSRHGDTVDVLMDEISSSFSRAIDALNSNHPNDQAPQPVTDPNSNTIIPSFRNRDEHAQKIISSRPFDDGYSWKKYGQKVITGATYPRCYFKCFLRKDQGCKALKQVQRTDADPTKFYVTYIGQHTCTAHSDASAPPHQCFISFGNDINSNINNEAQAHNWSNVGATSSSAVNLEPTSSANPSNSDSIASLFESCAGFYHEEN